jgi:hypothetical protein
MVHNPLPEALTETMHIGFGELGFGAIFIRSSSVLSAEQCLPHVISRRACAFGDIFAEVVDEALFIYVV